MAEQPGKKRAKGKKKPTVKRTSQAFASTVEYQRLAYILQHTETNKQAAARLGVSDRTIRRWKATGVPPRSAEKYGKKLRYVAQGIQQREKHLPPSQRPEPRALYYYRTFHGIRTKFWLVKGLPYDAILDIILTECFREIYSGFTYLLRLDAPFEGIWTGEQKFTRSDINNVPLRDRQALREAGSWVQVAMDKPYISSKIYPLLPGYCHPDEYTETLSHFFGLEYAEIYELRFREWRMYDEEGNYIGPGSE